MHLITTRALGALVILLCALDAAQGQDSTLDATGSIEATAQRVALTPVRPGDRVALHFLRDRELSETVEVDERGQASFPKIGVLKVGDLTIGALKDTLFARYSEYLRIPELEVAVLRRVVVNGEVRIPNVYMVDGTSTVRDVIARAGGITEVGNRNNVVIIRGGERIKVSDWERGDASSIDLQSGDEVVVGRKNWLVLNSLSVISTAVLVASFVISQVR